MAAGVSGNAIPTRVRAVVRERDGGHCLRCGAGGGLEQHHRRRRGVRDGYQHAFENVISLCGECHRWVHAHPQQAREGGFIVSAHVERVHEVALASFMGRVVLDDAGGIRWP